MGLIDYGQSKKLTDSLRVRFARLVLAMHSGDSCAVASALRGLGIETQRQGEPETVAKLAYSMFDTRGK